MDGKIILLLQTLTMKESHVACLVNLGSIIVMDRWTNARRIDGKIILLSHTFAMRGSHIASLVKFLPVL